MNCACNALSTVNSDAESASRGESGGAVQLNRRAGPAARTMLGPGAREPGETDMAEGQA